MAKRKYNYPIYFKNFTHEAGVYKITDITNGKIYIGAAYDVYHRLKTHVRQLLNGINSCRKLQENFNNHMDINNLKFELVELCPEKELRIYEQKALDKYLYAQEYLKFGDKRFELIGLNLSPTSANTTGVKYSNQGKINIANALRGRERSKLSSLKQSASILGKGNHKYGKPNSIETRKKISNSLKKLYSDPKNHPNYGNPSPKRKVVISLNIANGTIEEMQTKEIAAKEFGCCIGTIHNYVKSGKSLNGNLLFYK